MSYKKAFSRQNMICGGVLLHFTLPIVSTEKVKACYVTAYTGFAWTQSVLSLFWHCSNMCNIKLSIFPVTVLIWAAGRGELRRVLPEPCPGKQQLWTHTQDHNNTQSPVQRLHGDSQNTNRTIHTYVQHTGEGVVQAHICLYSNTQQIYRAHARSNRGGIPNEHV